MRKFLKWLIILIPVIILVIFLIIAALTPNNAAKTEDIKTVEYKTKDNKVTFTISEQYKKEDKGEYDLYLNKENKQIVGVFSFNLDEYVETNSKEILEKQIKGYTKSRKDIKLFKKENKISMDDKTITVIEYSGKTEKSTDCVYIFAVIDYKKDNKYVLYVHEVIAKDKYEENIGEMMDILKNTKYE